MNTNKKAIQLLEQNEYDQAFELFKQAVEESRDVQSLTNLAYIYMYEEEDAEEAIMLLKEVLRFSPHSHLPYNLLGEIYVRRERWSEAQDTLRKALAIQISTEAIYNLGIAEYRLGNIREATHYFLKSSNNYETVTYNYIKCLIELGETEKAKKQLHSFLQTAEEIGTIEVAELYVELGCFQEAIHFFEKGWNDYTKMSDWVSQYIYVLLQCDQDARAHELLKEVVQEIEEVMSELQEEKCDEVWTEEDKVKRLNELIVEKEEWGCLFKRISSGYMPQVTFEMDVSTGCYLFGCKRHNIPEYEM